MELCRSLVGERIPFKLIITGKSGGFLQRCRQIKTKRGGGRHSTLKIKTHRGKKTIKKRYLLKNNQAIVSILEGTHEFCGFA